MPRNPSGRVAYEAYATKREWKDPNNVQMQSWADMTKADRDCWNDAADSLISAWLQASDTTYPGVPTTLRMSRGTSIPRSESQPVLLQVGWLGATGIVYDIDDNPMGNERGSYTPLYIQVGTWVEMEPAKYGIRD